MKAINLPFFLSDFDQASSYITTVIRVTESHRIAYTVSLPNKYLRGRGEPILAAILQELVWSAPGIQFVVYLGLVLQILNQTARS